MSPRTNSMGIVRRSVCVVHVGGDAATVCERGMPRSGGTEIGWAQACGAWATLRSPLTHLLELLLRLLVEFLAGDGLLDVAQDHVQVLVETLHGGSAAAAIGATQVR